jgi:hypothetical protein
MYSEIGGHISASKEENDDLPACMIIPHAAFFIAIFWGALYPPT